MSAPQISVLGVYALPFTADLLQKQTNILYGADLTGKARSKAEQEIRSQLASTVLLEVLVQNRDRRFDVGDFCQPDDSIPKANWQAAWAEAYLTLDGQSLLVKRWCVPAAESDFRVAFFIHCWNPTQPILTSYGALECPQVEPMPLRLQKLVPYELVG